MNTSCKLTCGRARWTGMCCCMWMGSSLERPSMPAITPHQRAIYTTLWENNIPTSAIRVLQGLRSPPTCTHAKHHPRSQLPQYKQLPAELQHITTLRDEAPAWLRTPTSLKHSAQPWSLLRGWVSSRPVEAPQIRISWADYKKQRLTSSTKINYNDDSAHLFFLVGI